MGIGRYINKTPLSFLMHTTKWWALGLVILCTLFTSTAALLLKAGVMKVDSFLTVFNIMLLGGLALYAMAAVLLIIALKFGELSVLYPAVATSFIWVNIFSVILLNEDISFLRWAGAGLIILGVSMIGLGSRTVTKMRSRYL